MAVVASKGADSVPNPDPVQPLSRANFAGKLVEYTVFNLTLQAIYSVPFLIANTILNLSGLSRFHGIGSPYSFPGRLSFVIEDLNIKIINEVRISLKSVGGAIPCLFYSVLGLINPKQGAKLDKKAKFDGEKKQTAVSQAINAGGKGLATQILIDGYTGYLREYRDNGLRESYKVPEGYDTRLPYLLNKLIPRLQTAVNYVALRILQPRLVTVLFMLASLLTRTLDSVIGIMVAPMALFQAYLAIEQLEQVTELLAKAAFLGLQGLTVLLDLFYGFQHLIQPGYIDASTERESLRTGGSEHSWQRSTAIQELNQTKLKGTYWD